MFRSFSQALITAAMLIALLGQSLVYAHADCEMPMDTPHATSHNNMGHASLHAHDEMNHDTVMDAGKADMADCCGAECSCPSSSCSSISSLTSKPNAVPLEGNSNVRFRYSLKYPKTFSASLFRPPIVL